MVSGMAVEEKDEVAVDVVFSAGALEVRIRVLFVGSVSCVDGEFGDVWFFGVLSSSLVEGPRASVEESLSAPEDSSDDTE